MNHNDKYNLIFLHLPKCAGKSVVNALDIKTNTPENIDDYGYYKTHNSWKSITGRQWGGSGGIGQNLEGILD